MKQELESPGFRLSIIIGLEDFADPEKQKVKFCSHEEDDCFFARVNEPIQCLFDKCFEEGYDVKLGDIFRTKNELNHMRRLGVKLRQLLDLIEINGQQKDSFYMNTPLWRDITRLAKKNYDLLRKNEDMDELLASEQRRSARVEEEERQRQNKVKKADLE
jgi:hypothetical protein